MASSIFHDLIVAGLRTSFPFETRGEGGESLHRLLGETSTPVIAVSETPMSKLERVLVAFDGSSGSARALREFMLLAEPFDPEIVLVVAEKPAGESEFLLGHAELFLRDHGFGKISRETSSEPVEQVFARLLGGSSVDLVVMGMRSRHVIRDLFVGNFTRTMIERGDTTLLLAH